MNRYTAALVGLGFLVGLVLQSCLKAAPTPPPPAPVAASCVCNDQPSVQAQQGDRMPADATELCLRAIDSMLECRARATQENQEEAFDEDFPQLPPSAFKLYQPPR